MSLRQTALAIQNISDNITRIGDVNNKAIEAASHYLVDIALNLRSSEGQLVQTVAAGNEIDIANAVYDSIAVTEVSIGAAVDFYIMRTIHNSVA